MSSLFGLILSIVSALISPFLIAQSDDYNECAPRHTAIELGSGISYPLGLFAQWEHNENSNYFNHVHNIATGALNGNYLNIGFSRTLGQHTGILFNIRGAHHEATQLKNDEYPKNYSPMLGSGSTATSHQFSIGAWRQLCGVFGLYAEKTFQRISVEVNTGIGIQYTFSPAATLEEKGYTWNLSQGITSYYTSTKEQPSITAISPIARIGTKVAFDVSSRIAVNLQSDLTISYATFRGNLLFRTDSQDLTGEPSTRQSVENLTFEKRLNLLTVGIGISRCL